MNAARLSRPRDQIRVLLLENIHERAEQYFTDRGYTEVTRLGHALQGDDLAAAIADVHVVGVRSRTQLTADVLRHAERLGAIGCFCIGTNQVDLEVAMHGGVPVFHAPHSNTRSVAEMVIGFSIMLFRRIPEKSAAAHRGEWQKSAQGAHEIRGKTIGIVGYGHIGSQVSVLAESMGMQVRYFDIAPVMAHGNAQSCASLDELLQTSDIVTLHVPETPLTQQLMNADRMARMRPGAYLINAARGCVVDIDALAAAIQSGHLGGTAVDVFPTEPRSKSEALESPLQGLPNCILTPHVGGSTLEAQSAIAVDVASQIVAYSDTGNTTRSVNFPQLNLTPHENCHRLLHIHRNQPGVLRQINDLVADAAVNVVGQHLQTRGEVGYVVVDLAMDGCDPEGHGSDRDEQARALLERMRGIEGTIRARILY